MLYKELQVINELDAAIAGLHNDLVRLYQERASILNSPAGASKPAISKKTAAKSTTAEIERNYYILQAKWAGMGATFPTFKRLEKKLQRAYDLQTQIEQANPAWRGKLNIVAVPPTKILEKILATDPRAQQLFVLDDVALSNLPQRTVWSLTLAVDADQSLPIYGLTSFIERETYRQYCYDCRGMGLMELLAAELQGIQTVFDGSWTVLLRDYKDTGQVLCATYAEGQISFSTEDTNCLLGDNYLGLMVAC